MVTTYPRKKIEILVDKPLLRRIRALADEAGASGFTVLPTLAGDGKSGRWDDDQITGGAGSKVIFTTIMSETAANALLTALQPLLDRYSLIVAVTDVGIIRSTKFD